jgi:hypothetical protein
MAAERLSRLQRRILAWLLAEEQRTRGTMAASHHLAEGPGGQRAGDDHPDARRQGGGGGPDP